MNSITHRLCAGLMLLGLAGTASAQVAPPNIHFLVDTSGSMRELPQVVNSNHSEFFNITTHGCSNPRLDAFQMAFGWNQHTAYPVPDMGTGLGSDTGFPNLFQDSKFYGYMSWADSSSPVPQWDSKEQACQSQVPNWNTTNAAEYSLCLICLEAKGYFKQMNAVADTANPNPANLDFIFWGRFLNFNPPKYVVVRAALKQIIKDVQNTRVGFSSFLNSSPYTQLNRAQNATCDVALADPQAFDSGRASYVSAVNGLTFNTATPLARSLLNIGYYFTSGNDIYQSSFGFGSGYSYPSAFRNAPLNQQSRSVCWGCQHSAAIIITDGEPSNDGLSSMVASKLRTLNGGPVYCPASEWCGTSSKRDHGTTSSTPDTSYLNDHPDYYLDDVAKLLATHDLQSASPPVVGDFDTSGQQSLTVHTVGLGINSNLLRNTAQVGGGSYYTVDTVDGLKLALQMLVADAQNRAASVSCPNLP